MGIQIIATLDNVHYRKTVAVESVSNLVSTGSVDCQNGSDTKGLGDRFTSRNGMSIILVRAVVIVQNQQIIDTNPAYCSRIAACRYIVIRRATGGATGGATG